MDYRPVFDVGNGATEDFMGNRSDVATSEYHKSQQVQNRIAFSPAKVGMWNAACALLQMDQ